MKRKSTLPDSFYVGSHRGKMTIVSTVPGKLGRVYKLNCICDCGNEFTIYRHSYDKGLYSSCSQCRHLESAKRLNAVRPRVSLDIKETNTSSNLFYERGEGNV